MNRFKRYTRYVYDLFFYNQIFDFIFYCMSYSNHELLYITIKVW